MTISTGEGRFTDHGFKGLSIQVPDGDLFFDPRELWKPAQ